MAVELPSSEAEVQALLESAVSSRASHIRREIHTITMANVRRLLESDLGLEKSALDVHKALIRQLVDEVLLSSDNGEAQEEEEEEQKAVSEDVPKNTSSTKRLKKSSGKKAREENGSADQTEEKDLQEEAVHVEAPKKKKQKLKKEKDLQEEDMHVEAPKKKKQKEKEKGTTHIKQEEDEDGGGSLAEMSEEEEHDEAPKKKKQKVKKEEEESCSKEVDEDGGGSNAEMSEEDSDLKKPKKVFSKIASVKPVQNEKIEHLKKIIKACGLTISPSIYKRVKQQPDDEQDRFLIKELKDILSRRGLSSNPSDKEIKALKEKIAMEKDLEGIDTTNIIMEPRGRRATSQLFAPVYNPPPVEYDSEAEVDEESEDGADASEDEEKEFAAAEDAEDSD